MVEPDPKWSSCISVGLGNLGRYTDNRPSKCSASRKNGILGRTPTLQTQEGHAPTRPHFFRRAQSKSGLTLMSRRRCSCTAWRWASALALSRKAGSSTVVSLYVKGGSVHTVSPVLITFTSPTNLVPAAKHTSPFTVSFVHSLRDGTPSGVHRSSCETILYFFESRSMVGARATPGASTGRWPSSTVYASERRRKRSEHFFTGAKRDLGTSIAIAPGKHSIAAPIAVSSCQTGADASSFGSTVLSFRMAGSWMAPPEATSCASSASRRSQRLFVLKYACRATSWKAFSSASAHCADSRRMSWLSAFRTARWPPFLSFSVRRQTSIMNGAPDS